MKKLLLLGGSRYLIPVIEAAHRYGYYTITCDFLPHNTAHKFADEYHNVSILEKDEVLKLAQKLKIDGVMAFACDPGVTTAAYVAEKMGLPHSGSYKSVSILQNKGLFRKFLSDNGFNTPTAKGYRSIDEALADVDLFHWPVIVKPTDAAGSKGVTRVISPDELKASINHALSFSHSDEFIIEDFLEKAGCSSDTDCFSVNGELKFVSFSAQRFDESCENPYVPAAYSWPATLSELHQKELTSEIQRLLNLLNMKTSIYNVETRVCTDGKAYIMEVSPRGGGNRLAEMLRYATGQDLITNAVFAALGETVNVSQKPFNGYWAEIILHSKHPGVFKKLYVADSIQANVVEKDLWVNQGDKIGGFTGANEAIGTLVLHFETQNEMECILAHQEEYVQVIVDEEV